MNSNTPIFSFTNVGFTWPDGKTPVFSSFSAEIPGGFISLTGPNGSGKSTFMLLAGGRILPSSGTVKLAGNDTRILCGAWQDSSGTSGPGLTPEIEHRRNLVCSYLYQNMEFEADSSDVGNVGTLLEFVFTNGGCPIKKDTILNDTIKTFELENILSRSISAISKGELQRVLLAFSALYGSQVIIMDEPIFAMEARQKEKALEFFRDLHLQTGVSILVSLHELALTRKYAETVMLFYPDKRIDMGTCDEVLTKETLEAAYGVPFAMLHEAENLSRKTMLENH